MTLIVPLRGPRNGSAVARFTVVRQNEPHRAHMVASTVRRGVLGVLVASDLVVVAAAWLRSVLRYFKAATEV